MPTEIKAQNTTTLASVKAIYDAAEEANGILDDMNAAATAAHTTLTGIYADAEQAAQDASDAKTAAGTAQTAADSALVNLSTVQDVVGVLNWITAHGTMTLTSDVTVNPAHVYFIVDAGGDYVVGGTHYSIVSEPKDAELSTYYELTVDESVQNYVATHIVVDSEGLWIVPDAGGNKVLIATGSGSTYTTAGTYIIGKVNNVDTVFAKFTSDGATMQAENNTQIAHLGYGQAYDDQGQLVDAPYYTLGTRYSNSAVGGYSIAEGYETKAEGWGSHAEGAGTRASGVNSHAEGLYSTAQGAESHAEGQGSGAGGQQAHAEGYASSAMGDNSHAQNTGTFTVSKSQTALGEFNVLDTTGSVSTRGTYAAIIGNGTANDARSNALTVDWNGNVDIASGAKYKINGTPLAASDVGAEPTLTNISESGGTYSGGIEDEKLLTTATINKWKTILGIS